MKFGIGQASSSDHLRWRSEDPDVANILESYASLLRNTKREVEAAVFEARIKAIRAKIQVGALMLHNTALSVTKRGVCPRFGMVSYLNVGPKGSGSPKGST